jgi:hypothetical protein
MFEFYLDDMLVQTFNTTHEPGGIGLTPRRIGFIAENGQGYFENLRAWSMSLDEETGVAFCSAKASPALRYFRGAKGDNTAGDNTAVE